MQVTQGFTRTVIQLKDHYHSQFYLKLALHFSHEIIRLKKINNM
jgi:hypothetical protein